MTLYISEMYDGNNGDNTVLGVFSTPALAEHAGSKYFDDMGYTGVELLDWDNENNIYSHYYSHKCTLTVTEWELDKGL